MKRIYVNEKWCLGCHLCEYECAFANSGMTDMAKALKGKEIHPNIRVEDGTEFLQKLSKALSALEFQIVVMYMDGMTCGQISDATGRDLKSIDNALQRSKKKLAKILQTT